MGAQLSFVARRAMQLHRRINDENEADPFDQDYDSSEVPRVVLDRWHPSFNRAAPKPIPDEIPVAEARRRLAAVKALITCHAPQNVNQAPESLKHITCWRDTPELYRKMVARVSGLGADVVEKIDRDLTEQEKAMIRAAVTDMRDHFNSLVHL